MATDNDKDIPQWKKDLIARLRIQNKCSASITVWRQPFTGPPQSLSAAVGRAGQQPSLTSTLTSSPVSDSRPSVPWQCNEVPESNKMVQERAWFDYKYDSFETVSESLENGNYCKSSDSDSSEEIHFGPGIVNKLKNKYLSLALRRENHGRPRPSIHNLRKATSLENMLDEDDPPKGSVTFKARLFQSRLNGSNDTAKNVPNRYRNVKRVGSELKRARSVEAISSVVKDENLTEDTKPKRESLHEDMLIMDSEEGSDKSYRKIKDNKIIEPNTDIHAFSNNYVPRNNRPKRVAPIMNETEKPPMDVVKHAKMIFEKRPELRTKQPVTTGEVAAKVATYKNIIVQSKGIKKPPIKTKPNNLPVDKTKVSTTRSVAKTRITIEQKRKEVDYIDKRDAPISKTDVEGGVFSPTDKKQKPQVPSPIPDISMIDILNKCEKEGSVSSSSLCETPDLILISTPASITSPTYKRIVTANFLQEEINNTLFDTTDAPRKYETISNTKREQTLDNDLESFGIKQISTQSLNNIKNSSETLTFNFANSNVNQDHLPGNKSSPKIFPKATSLQNNVPYNQPLKVIINGNSNKTVSKSLSPLLLSPPKSPRIMVSPLDNFLPKIKNTSSPIIHENYIAFKSHVTDRVIEKNLINTAKTLEQPKSSIPSASAKKDVESEESPRIQVPKKVKKPPREPETNSIVFKFTDRKDVPDYVGNDRSSSPRARLEKPKVGESGIILMPGASIDESFTDEDEEFMRFLEEPPSPCDVTFINDNIIIDGKSSFSQKSKKHRLTISFVEAGPDVYEYPSESSLLLEEISPSPTTPTNAQVGHSVPTLAGSSLANYTPKSMEDFQPGITRSISNIPSKPETPTVSEMEQPILEEITEPLLFSAGTNSDILF